MAMWRTVGALLLIVHAGKNYFITPKYTVKLQVSVFVLFVDFFSVQLKSFYILIISFICISVEKVKCCIR